MLFFVKSVIFLFNSLRYRYRKQSSHEMTQISTSRDFGHFMPWDIVVTIPFVGRPNVTERVSPSYLVSKIEYWSSSILWIQVSIMSVVSAYIKYFKQIHAVSDRFWRFYICTAMLGWRERYIFDPCIL